MTGALDVSGAMEILLQKEKADNFSKILRESTLVVAPDLYIAELTNTLWKYCTAKIRFYKEVVRKLQFPNNSNKPQRDTEVWA